jgi:hypothetical protein
MPILNQEESDLLDFLENRKKKEISSPNPRFTIDIIPKSGKARETQDNSDYFSFIKNLNESGKLNII